ncbi:hypothetical protein [Streptacidiphilus albus]|jgi:hypothetical protein|uniref:hypothetical protein n=1 Tax=Streptacidiphilus albus TaxID=105425 RepID=UPI00054BB27C|nr:hypothetical protein [Streptacidiphilus albus]
MANNTWTRARSIVAMTVLGFAALTGATVASLGTTAHCAGRAQSCVIQADGTTPTPAPTSTVAPADGGTANG